MAPRVPAALLPGTATTALLLPLPLPHITRKGDFTNILVPETWDPDLAFPLQGAVFLNQFSCR